MAVCWAAVIRLRATSRSILIFPRLPDDALEDEDDVKFLRDELNQRLHEYGSNVGIYKVRIMHDSYAVTMIRKTALN